MTASVAVFLGLLLARHAGFWGYALRPGVWDAQSARLWLTHGVWPLLLAAAAWAAGHGLGRRLLRRLGGDGSGATTAAALGLGSLAWTVQAAALAGAATAPVLTALAAATAALAWGARLPRASPAPRGPLEGGAAGLLAFAALVVVVRALAPPVDWDARAYHLALPELYLRLGARPELPWQFHSHFPHLMEHLYILPLALGRDGAAALLHAGAAFALTGAVAVLARESAGRAAGWTAALVLAGQPAFHALAATAHSDAWCALFFLAAARALARWDEERSDGWLAAAGLLAGLSAASKLFGGAGAVSWALWLAWRTRRPREALLFSAAAALPVLPGLAATWLRAGDPLWPLLSGSLGLDADAAALAARYVENATWPWPPPAWALTRYGPGFLLIPLAALYASGRRAAAAPGRVERLLWTAAPLLTLLALRQREAWRFLMPAYAAAALAAGRWGAASFASGGARRVAAALAVALAAAPLAATSANNELFAVLAPRPASAPDADRRARFEERAVDVAAFYREARAVLPPDAKVLLFREVRGYGAGFDYVWGDPVNQVAVDYRRLPGPAALASRLKELGVTHVLDNGATTLYGEDPSYYDRRTLALMAACLRAHARPALARGPIVLHQLL